MMQRTLVAMVMLVAWCAPAQAQDVREDPRHVPAAVLAAQQVLVAAYPELREGRLAWRIAPTATGALVEVRPAPIGFARRDDEPALVAAMVVSDAEGQVQELRAGGTLIEAVRQRVARGADATADVLARAGAKYRPDDPTALDALVPAGLPATLRALIVRERTFRSDGPVDEALTWRVEIESGDVVPQRYTLVFEPVEGRLLSVVRR